jgi:hypothetical protein
VIGRGREEKDLCNSLLKKGGGKILPYNWHAQPVWF